MLTANPRHWFSWNYAVTLQSRQIAVIDISWWREKGTLTVDGRQYGVHRERLMSGKFILDLDGTIVATAQKPSSLRRRLLIDHAGTQYELKPRDMFTRTFQLYAGSTLVGSLSAKGLFSRRMNVDLPEALPLPVRVFVMWLTVLLWKRDSEAAGS